MSGWVPQGNAQADLEANLSAEQLIPGDLDSVRAAAQEAHATSEVLADVAQALAYIDVEWTGIAADRFRELQDYQPTEFKSASRDFHAAENALNRYADALHEARGEAEAARAQYQKGKADKAAYEASAGAVGLPAPLVGPGPDEFGMPGAVTKLIAARHGLNLAGDGAANALRFAADNAPRPKSKGRHADNPGWKNAVHWYAHGGQVPTSWREDNGLKGLGAGILQTGMDTVNMVNPFSRFADPVDDFIGYEAEPLDESWRYQAGALAFVIGTAGIGGGAGGAKVLGRGGAVSGLIGRIFKRPIAQDAVETLVVRQKGWKVGDPIENLTAKGSEPGWTTVRTRYWKNIADDALPGEFRPADLARMAEGKPPLHHHIQVPKELDHIVQRQHGGTHAKENLREVWPWEHAALDPHRHYKGPVPADFDPAELMRRWATPQ